MADSEVAKKPESKNLAVICFDYENSLICPKSEASAFYYKRKLSVNNFTVVRVVKKMKSSAMSMTKLWPTKDLSKLPAFCARISQAEFEEGVTDFRLYCHNCWGQNKNRAVATLLAYLAFKFAGKGIQITLRFQEKRHSYNAADNVHSLIERKIRTVDIYTPDQYYERMASAKRYKTSPIKFIRVQQDMISNWMELADMLNFAKDIDGTTVPFTKIRELRVNSNSPYQVNFKVSLEQVESKVISLKKVGKPVNFGTYKLLAFYTDGPLPISKKKKEDLVHYCQHNLIPKEHHDFFTSLLATNETVLDEDDPPPVPPPGRERKRRAPQDKNRSKKRRE